MFGGESGGDGIDEDNRLVLAVTVGGIVTVVERVETEVMVVAMVVVEVVLTVMVEEWRCTTSL